LGRVQVAKVPESTFTQYLDRASVMLGAVTGLLGHVSEVLRLLVHVACWLVLLTGSVGLLLHPVLSPEHLVISGISALGALRTLIKPPKVATGKARLTTTVDKS